jgi:GntR family transcriptional regulator
MAARQAWRLADMSEWGSSAPAYVRVANDLRRKIESGELGPGAQLPSVTELIRLYDVSNTTAQSAIRILKSTGLVEALRGKGVYVRRVQRVISRSADYTSPPAEGERAKYRAKSDQLVITEVAPPDDVAEKLHVDEDGRVVKRSRVMVEKDKPVEIVASYFPVEIARDTELDRPSRIPGGTLAALRRLGYPPRHPAKEWVETRMPTAEESRILDLPPGTPVLRLLRLTCTDNSRPAEVLEMVFGGDRYQLEYDLPVHE